MTSRTCTLSNLSLVPITFHLRVPHDGQRPSVRSRTNSPQHIHGTSSPLAAPREFEIWPSSGVLAPQSRLDVRVDLCSNTVRKYHTELHVDVDDVQQGLLLLPLTARYVTSLHDVSPTHQQLPVCMNRPQHSVNSVSCVVSVVEQCERDTSPVKRCTCAA